MSYKVLVRQDQFFGDEYTVGDVFCHFAERADLKTPSADMLFYNRFKPNSISVITKHISDELRLRHISPEEKAVNYMDRSYPFVLEKDAEEFVKEPCEQDTPVIDKEGIPQYVILKGYRKTGRTEHYICKVLSGLSSYDLSVNADMSVSCGCMLRGSGLLGNLRDQTLKEIFDSEHVSDIRKSLYDGFLPTVSCSMRCGELQQVPKSLGMYYLEHYSLPKTIMFENTSICNLKCEGCYNAYIGYETVSIEDTERFAIEIKNNGIRHVDVFKYGETFADRELGEKLKIIKKINPDVTLAVSTNGMLLDIGDNMENALNFDYILISLDGVDNETVTGFQKNSSFDRVYKNMVSLIKKKSEAGKVKPVVVWKYVLFQHNDNDAYLKKALDLAKKAGVDKIQFFTGFNTEKTSGAVWKSDVFLPYINQFDFSFNNSVLSIDFKKNG